jgi:WD40 repeat protein
LNVNALSLAWTPDGQQLVVGCLNGSIKLFEPSAGSLLAAWKGHKQVVNAITVSSNNKFIASGSWDSTVRLWDTTTHQQIGPALQHDTIVRSVAISPDGSHLASGGRDGNVRVWSVKDVIPISLLGPATFKDAVCVLRFTCLSSP